MQLATRYKLLVAAVVQSLYSHDIATEDFSASLPIYLLITKLQLTASIHGSKLMYDRNLIIDLQLAKRK